MHNEKRTISPLLYYLLTAGLTNLIFVVVGAVVVVLLSPTLKLDTILVGVIIFVLLQKSLIVGYVTYSFHKQGRFDKVSGTRVIGFYFGRLFGLLIGAFIGSKIGGGIGALIGAIAFYFLGRWIGFKVGFVVGRLLDKNLPVADLSEKVVARPSPSKRLFFVAYAAIFPLLMLLLASFFKFNHIQLPNSPANTLPTARIIVIALSIFSLVAPWFIQRRMSQKQIPNSAFSLFWIGLALSFAPVIYGFFLFILGASILELGVFAVASSLAAIIWIRKINIEDQKAG
jgi:hypothetical protein